MWVTFSHLIPTGSGIDVYNMSWKPPGRSIVGFDVMNVYFTGCNFDVYQLYDLYPKTLICTVTCPSDGVVTEIDPEFYEPQQCNGTGCCNGQLKGGQLSSLNFQFVRHDHKLQGEAEMQPPTPNSLWDRIEPSEYDAENVTAVVLYHG
nr:unnamed protein product [Digitaria exilis]